MNSFLEKEPHKSNINMQNIVAPKESGTLSASTHQEDDDTGLAGTEAADPHPFMIEEHSRPPSHNVEKIQRAQDEGYVTHAATILNENSEVVHVPRPRKKLASASNPH